jgi:cytosine/adenosine deaminase-related metal-dependent hydrolase
VGVTTRTLIRGACVLTLGARSPNHAQADVLIDEGKVAEVGPALRARNAEIVDATDTIVMPGFVDTHRHIWTSLFRNLGRGDAGDARPAAGSVIDHFGPDDVYAATLVGALGAVEAGITTLVDWAELPPDPACADAALQAHAEAGLRTVFVHVPHPSAGGDDGRGSVGPALGRLAAAAGPSTTIAFGSSAIAEPGLDAQAADWASARSLGLHVHAHDASTTPGSGAVAEMARRGLLDPNVTLVHPTGLDDADLQTLVSSGASVSLSPAAQMTGGLGSPPVQELIDRRVRMGLGVDDERVAPGDLFAQMRATISLQHATVFDRKLAGKAGLPRLMSTRDVIRSATADGARVAGLGGVTGSLEPGMRADLILLRTDRPNVFPINDPIGAVVWGMDTSNVDAVFVDGRALMREGVLQADVQRARDLATTAHHRVAASAGLLVGIAADGRA